MVALTLEEVGTTMPQMKKVTKAHSLKVQLIASVYRSLPNKNGKLNVVAITQIAIIQYFI